jgi:hypothetical protein
VLSIFVLRVQSFLQPKYSRSWSFSKLLSSKMGIATGKYPWLSVHLGRSLCLEKIQPCHFLPFVSTDLNYISKALSKHNIKSVGLPLTKISSLLQTAKDDLHLKTLGMYITFCLRGQVYSRWTDHSFQTGVKEQHWHTHLYHLDTSVMAGHSNSVGYCIQLQNARILSTKSKCTTSSGKRYRLSSIPII